MVKTTGSEPDSADTEERDALPLPLDEDLDVHNTTMDGIAAVLNPRLGDEAKYSFPAGCSCIVVSKGKSLIEGSLEGVDVWEHFHAQRSNIYSAFQCVLFMLYLIPQDQRSTYGPYLYFRGLSHTPPANSRGGSEKETSNHPH
jgi:hypothetical protein